jgi:hypothetical protein
MRCMHGLVKGRVGPVFGAMLLAFAARSGAQTTARPTIVDLSPNSATAGATEFILTVDGTGFVLTAPAPSAGPSLG